MGSKMGKNIDAAWSGWLRQNIARNCNPEELLDILIKNGFALSSIKKEMGNSFPHYSSLIALFGEDPVTVDYEALCNVRITRAEEPQITRFDTSRIQLYTIDDFMSEDECDAITDIIRQSLRSSTITVKSRDKYYRTSSTSDLGLLNNKTIEALDKKISRTIGICPHYSETIQGQHYAVGQEFKKHTDFFSPGTQEYLEHASGKGGNRTWTFMVYLNTVARGGGTHFPMIGHIFEPKKGQAVIWNNLNSDGSPNYETLHAGLPIKEGEKTIITKWFREHGSGPMCCAD